MADIIKLFRINQLGAKAIYVGKMRYSQLQNKVTLTKRLVSGDEEYQRESDISRINKIADFLKNHDKVVSPFPTPLVLALSTEQDELISIEKISDKKVTYLQDYFEREEPLAVLINNEGNSDIDSSTEDYFELHIPSIKEKIFIVDGQHRFRGVQQYFKNTDNASDIEFAVTFLLDYDIYEQAEVFANINFKQKPVNKSLYYDIFGTLPGRNKYTFAHYLVKSINDKPPLDGIVKMLGTGSGIVSLAFMVETIINQIFGFKGELYKIYQEYEELDILEQNLNELKKENETSPDIVLSQKIDEVQTKIANIKNYKKIPQLLAYYLSYYDSRFEKYFPKKVRHPKYEDLIFNSYNYPYYLFKATGMFGVLKIFNDLFENQIINLDDDQKTMYESLDKAMDVILNNQSFFFEDTRLLGAGSASLQGKFYKMLYSAIFEKRLEKH